VNTPTSEFFALQRVVAGRFSLVRELGRGGSGVVFLAQDVALDRHVAIKLLPPALACRDDLRAAFLREARTAAGPSPPRIVATHPVEETPGRPFFVMAFVDGETLGARVRRAGPLSSAEAMRVTQEIAWALGHAHARGVIHRDVKPDNILLERGTDRAIVADFGIAAVCCSPGVAAGEAVGTPQYASPEQGRGAPTDGRSDLYALGGTAWFALTGTLPFDGSASALLMQHATMPLPSLAGVLPSTTRVPARFVQAVEKCLAKNPDDRFASAEALAVEIDVAKIGTVAAPPAIRAFVRNAESAGGEMGTALVVSVLSTVVLWSAFGDDLFAAPVFFTASALAAGLAGIRFAQVILNARHLLSDGYDEATVRAETLREEAARAEVGTGRSRRVRIATWLLLGWAVVKTSGMAYLVSMDGPLWLGILGAAGMVIVPTFALRMLWDDLRGGRSLWNRMLAGRLGRFVFRVAGLFVRRPRAVTAPPGEPTVSLLGGAAREAFDALPPAQRAQLAEVPPLVERLRAAALRLRGRDDTPSRERFASVVTALEGVRLDLLRVNAGSAAAVEITADLERAAEVGARVDATLASGLAVDGLLRNPKPGARPDYDTPTVGR